MIIYRLCLVGSTEEMNVPLSNSADPGPVRDLQCDYDPSRSNKLICEWSAPDHANGRIKHYIVNLSDHEKAILNEPATNTSWQSRQILKYGEKYRVSVSTVTYAVGPPVSTRIDFISTGKMQIATAPVPSHKMNFL